MKQTSQSIQDALNLAWLQSVAEDPRKARNKLEKAMGMYINGSPVEQIAAQCGYTISTVRNYATNLGVKRPAKFAIGVKPPKKQDSGKTYTLPSSAQTLQSKGVRKPREYRERSLNQRQKEFAKLLFDGVHQLEAYCKAYGKVMVNASMKHYNNLASGASQAKNNALVQQEIKRLTVEKEQDAERAAGLQAAAAKIQNLNIEEAEALQSAERKAWIMRTNAWLNEIDERNAFHSEDLVVEGYQKKKSDSIQQSPELTPAPQRENSYPHSPQIAKLQDSLDRLTRMVQLVIDQNRIDSLQSMRKAVEDAKLADLNPVRHQVFPEQALRAGWPLPEQAKACDPDQERRSKMVNAAWPFISSPSK